MADRKRESVGERKLIIGVPVLPGLPLQMETTIRDSDADSVSSLPAEDSLISPFGTMMIPAAPSPSGGGGPNPPTWKLKHMDFVPGLVKSKKEEDYELFSSLMDKANEWSVANPQALIFTCETVQWMSADRPIYTDSGVIHKSMHSDKKTRVMRGLRLWYMLLDDTFFDASDRSKCPGPVKLTYTNYIPEAKTDNFHNMLKRLNEDLLKKAIPGRKILRVETLHQLSDCADPDTNSWREQPDNSRDYFSFIRVFSMLRAEDTPKTSELGVRDFFPAYDQRTPHSQGYETFSDLWRKAARWQFMNPRLHIISFQSVFVKIKKGDSDQITFFDRCYFREHNSSYGSMGHNRTEYIQLLRCVFTQAQPPAKPDAPLAQRRLFYKHFGPFKLRRGAESASGDDMEPLEYLYEDLQHVEAKINSWLVYSGARILGMETIPTRLTTGGQETVGPEATYCYNDREKNVHREYWRVHLRVYIEGNFKEIAALPAKLV